MQGQPVERCLEISKNILKYKCLEHIVVKKITCNRMSFGKQYTRTSSSAASERRGENLKALGLSIESQGHNPALTVLYVPYSLDRCGRCCKNLKATRPNDSLSEALTLEKSKARRVSGNKAKRLPVAGLRSMEQNVAFHKFHRETIREIPGLLSQLSLENRQRIKKWRRVFVG